MKKYTFDVYLSYNGDDYFKNRRAYLEMMLDTLATKFGGEWYDSGYGMDMRDLHYGGFKTKENANLFKKRAMAYTTFRWKKRMCIVESREDFS